MSEQIIEAKVKFGMSGLDKQVRMRVVCRDRLCIVWMSNKKLLKSMYKDHLKKGRKVSFDNGNSLLSEEYPDKSKEEIFDIIKDELKPQGINLEC